MTTTKCRLDVAVGRNVLARQAAYHSYAAEAENERGQYRPSSQPSTSLPGQARSVQTTTASSPRVQEKASPHTVRICAGVLPVSRGDRTPRSDDNPENPDRGDKWNSSAWSLVVARPAIASACAIACSVVVLPALARLVISTWASGLVGASF